MKLINAEMKHFILVTLFYISVEAIVFCQSTSTCGTTVSLKQQALEKSFTIPQVSYLQNMPQVNRSISFMVYIVNDNPKNAMPIIITSAIIKKILDDLQPYFAPIALTFKLYGVQNVPNYQLNEIIQGSGNEMVLTKSYYIPNCINLYLVDNLYNVNSSDVGSYATMPADSSNLFLMRKSSLNSVVLAHQIGHFLGLYHTHEIIFGKEAVSRTAECDVTGDRCCDTEADPTIAGLVANCLYKGNIKDQNNEFYHPSSKNIMSFSETSCQCNFTTMQFTRMIYTLNNFKMSLF